jgi:hypothetical protein
MGGAVGMVSGAGLFLATIILLLKGGTVIGPNLSLLNNYLIGFEVTWKGAFVGFIEACVIGFIIGYVFAWLRNSGMSAYAALVKRRAAQQTPRDFLDKV